MGRTMPHVPLRGNTDTCAVLARGPRARANRSRCPDLNRRPAVYETGSPRRRQSEVESRRRVNATGRHGPSPAVTANSGINSGIDPHPPRSNGLEAPSAAQDRRPGGNWADGSSFWRDLVWWERHLDPRGETWLACYYGGRGSFSRLRLRHAGRADGEGSGSRRLRPNLC